MSGSGTLPELLAERARVDADRDAVITPDESITWAEVDQRSAARAADLLELGVRKGSMVALLLPNGIDWVIWWSACARVGAPVVPINTFATSAELHRILEHSGAHVLVATPEFAGRRYRNDLIQLLGDGGGAADRLAPRFPQLRRVLWSDGEPVGARLRSLEVVEALGADVVAADLLTIIYSSGSTGEPKGVLHSHGTTLRQASKLAEVTAARRSTVLWTSMPLNWVGGLVWSFLRVAVVGGTLVTQERFEPWAALELIRRAGVDTVTAWGPVIQQLRGHSAYGSELDRIVGLAPPSTSGVARPSALGMTETLGPHCGWFGTAADEVPEGAHGSMGEVLPGMEHRVIDPDSGVPVGEGDIGELLVRGDTLMVGLHRVERVHTFTPDGWYRTRDAVSVRGGWVRFHGRLDDVIKTSGANVAPAEVVVILEGDPTVRHAFVVGIAHAVRGQDVVAFIVPTSTPFDVEGLLAMAKEQLAPYKVPRRVLVLAEDEVPWLSSQKVDVRGLRAMAEAAAVGPSALGGRPGNRNHSERA